MKKEFVEAALQFLKEEGQSAEHIEGMLNGAWMSGASSAFYFPQETYKEVGEAGRQIFAEGVIDSVVIDDMEKELGVDLHEDDREKMLKFALSREKTTPLMNLSKGEPPSFISGFRSNN